MYATSVATHRGEFWPFSIFPMFSLACRPWTRALVLDVTDVSPAPDWGPWDRDHLPGAPYPTRRLGISTNDLAKLVQLTTGWTAERLATLRRLCRPGLDAGRELVLTRADGRFEEGKDLVAIVFTPLVRMTPTEDVVNPSLSTGHR